MAINEIVTSCNNGEDSHNIERAADADSKEVAVEEAKVTTITKKYPNDDDDFLQLYRLSEEDEETMTLNTTTSTTTAATDCTNSSMALQLANTKVNVSALSAQAELQVAELCCLLTKLKTNTATQEELNQVQALNDQINIVKKSIKELRARETDQELTVLRHISRQKKNELLHVVKEREIQEALQAVTAAENVDLAFVVDATFSMQPHIDNVKKNIREIINKIKKTNVDLKLRLALVAYRDLDHSDRHQKRFEVLDFSDTSVTTTMVEFHRFLTALPVLGGVDAPEDLAGGIQQANFLSWRHPTRVVFVVADSPCHGREFHSCARDRYPLGTPGIDIIEELRMLLAHHNDTGSMTVFFGRITGATDQMIARLEQYGISLPVVAFDDADKVVSAVTHGVRSSIFKTMSLSNQSLHSISISPINLMNSVGSLGQKGQVRLKRYRVKPTLPCIDEWGASRPSVCVRVYRSRPLQSTEDLKGPFRFGVVRNRHLSRADQAEHSHMVLRRAESPFAEGETRISFHGRIAPVEEELDLQKSAVVLKSFKYQGEGVNDLRQHLKQMEISNIACYLSRLYNHTVRPAHCRRVNFLTVCVVEDLDESKEEQGTRRFCAEGPLPCNATAFTQYSNNTGYWNQDKLDETLLRFTEFTYQETNGYLMVTDLQGVRKGGDFFLTDPVVLCQDILRFGHTNLGGTMIQKCIDATWAIMDERGW